MRSIDSIEKKATASPMVAMHAISDPPARMVVRQVANRL